MYNIQCINILLLYQCTNLAQYCDTNSAVVKVIRNIYVNNFKQKKVIIKQRIAILTISLKTLVVAILREIFIESTAWILQGTSQPKTDKVFSWKH